MERAVVADHDDMRAPGRHLINMHRIRRSKKLCCHSRNWECFAVACARGLPLHKDEHPYLLSEIAPVTENVPYVRNARLLLESVEAVWRTRLFPGIRAEAVKLPTYRAVGEPW